MYSYHNFRKRSFAIIKLFFRIRPDSVSQYESSVDISYRQEVEGIGYVFLMICLNIK
jgi:hypothetical protein